MNKLLTFMQAKGKWHKFPSFNLGGGAKLYKNFAQKLLAVSLCMAMVLLGVPRGQNFVAEAAEEATKSVALLTLTLTGDEDEPLEAKMEWKSFVQGTTVGLEVVFVDEDGNASEPRDYGTWLDTYGGLNRGDDGFEPFAPEPWLEALPSGSGIPVLFGGAWRDSLFPFLRSFLGTRDWLAPLPFLLGGSDSTDFFGSVGSPGLARVPLGSSLTVLPHPFFPELIFATDGGLPPDVRVTTAFSVAETDTSVVSFDSSSASIVGVGVGVTTLSLSATLTVTSPIGQSDVLGPLSLGSIAVEVYEVNAGGADFLHDTVHVDGKPQRLRVYDPNGVLPADTTFKAEYVDGSHRDHNFFITHLDPATDVELQHFYNLTLTSAGQTLSELDGPVELWFEAIDGIDAADSFISRVAEGPDAKLTPTLYTDADGVTWIKVLTDHFSPYALTDLLSAEEKAALAKENSGPKNNVKTGDHAAQLAVAGLGMVLVLVLGIMLRLITSKKKFEE